MKPLDQLEEKLAVIRDRVRGVALGNHAGFYLHGRPGTSKTHTVLTTLDRENIPHRPTTGHLTPIGLFDLLSDNPSGLIVLDDMAQILTQPIAVQLLLAALGNGPNKGDRSIEYNRSGQRRQIWFSGGIIMISNFELEVNAIKSRVHSVNYDPTDEQIAALIESLAEKGLSGLTPKTCQRVAEHVLSECLRLDYRPEVRLFVDKAIQDYKLWKNCETETHWQDLISCAIQERATELQHGLRPIGRTARIQTEKNLVAALVAKYETRAEQVAAWKEQTGKSKRAFYRRLETPAA